MAAAVLGKRARDDSLGAGGAERRRKKIPFPTDQPEFNFLGLIVGPRGSTQKQLEQQSGARILVRGKGASKEGEDGSEEEQHVLILADDDAQLQRAEQLVLELLHDPQKAMVLKQQQLKEVALQQSQQDAGNGFGSSSSSSLYSSAPSALHGSSVGEHSMEMRIPSERVGLVIGKMGETIRQLQQMTGCSIQVAKESAGGDGDRVVTLRGTDEQIVRADEEIRRVISSGGLLSTSGLRSAASLSSSSHAGVGYGGSSTLTMQIPNIAVGLLIGKSGETIRSMQQKTGAIIQVQRNTEVDPTSSTREVVLSGNEQQVEAARREVEFIVQEKLELEQRASRSAMGGPPMGGQLGGDGRDGPAAGGGMPGGGGGGGGGGDGRNSIVLRVPNVAVGTVIGRGGETIKQLQAMTGARIQIDRNDDMKMEREVTISGLADDVERARLEIEELIRQKTTIGGMVPPPSPYGSAYGRGAPPPGWPPYGPPPGYGYPPYGPPLGYGYPPADYPYGQQPPPAEYGQYPQQPPPHGAAFPAAAAPPAGYYDAAPARAENGQEQSAAASATHPAAASPSSSSPSQSSPPAAAAADSAPPSCCDHPNAADGRVGISGVLGSPEPRAAAGVLQALLS